MHNTSDPTGSEKRLQAFKMMSKNYHSRTQHSNFITRWTTTAAIKATSVPKISAVKAFAGPDIKIHPF